MICCGYCGEKWVCPEGHSETVESGREHCRGRKRPAYRYTERGKCVERT